MIDRRTVVKTICLGCAMAGAGTLGGCFGEAETGPVKIVYGRDTCDYCRMIISDPRYAVQIRQGPGKTAFKFDDIGDAVFFLEEQDWKAEETVEFWVMDVTEGKTWLDARTAYYLSGLQSPMAYGYGAVENAAPETITYATMTEKVLAGGSRTRCVPPSGPQAEQT
ncbi:MAG: hypothetical protein KDJ16_11010 [Hyphomicrobiales bacterium]|nr:hypothetical protein [Hyphomicrobiales bacterium]